VRTFLQRIQELWQSPSPDASREIFARITGEPVGNDALYAEAMRHRSLLRERRNGEEGSNERLEFLGDAVLGFLTAEYLFQAYPDEDEGYMTRLRSKLVSGRALATRASEIGLGEFILLSENMTQLRGDRNANILADAFEALIGAVFLDQGIEAARRFVRRAALDPVNLAELAEKEDNYKSLLLEYAQARGWAQPVYRLLAAEGPSHARRFQVEAVVGDNAWGTGEAGSKKRAEQRAAEEALSNLRSRDADVEAASG
jgi:ribonuclease-3